MKDLVARAKKYLEDVRHVDETINRLVCEHENLKKKIYDLKAMAYDREHVSGGQIQDLSDLIAKIDADSRRVNQEVDNWIDIREKTRIMIHNVPDNMERNVLVMRYITNLKWDDLMEKLHISRATSFRLHRSALYNFAKYNKLRLYETIDL